MNFQTYQLNFLIGFTPDDFDVDIFMKIPLGMGVDGNRGEWVLKFKKKQFMESRKKVIKV